MEIWKKINFEKAKGPKSKIILCEGDNPLVFNAGVTAMKQGIASMIILNGKETSGVQIIDTKKVNTDRYAQRYCHLRKNKVTLDQSKELMTQPIFLATMMLELGEADGLVAGATMTTADTLRPALQILKTSSIASSFFLMLLKEKLFIFADCALNIDPDAEQLAHIAISTADSALALSIEPRIAMLSFSTHGSAKHPCLDKVVKATKIVRKIRPDLKIDGELQVDAAIIPYIAEKKCSGSLLKGDANILIFPDLNSGNIAYKLVERLAGAQAIGPIVQGLKKPVNDVSRGCSQEDIVNVISITALQVRH